MTRERYAQSLILALSRETAGERVIWQAARLPRIERSHFGIYLFAVPWTAFALFWTVMAAGASAASMDSLGPLSLAFPLFGLPFIAVGAAMLAMPFAGLFMGPRTLYAATEKRLLKISMGRALKVESIPAERLGASQRSERPDGSGSLSFAIAVGTDSDGDAKVERLELADIPQVFEASKTIDRMLAGVRLRATTREAERISS